MKQYEDISLTNSLKEYKMTIGDLLEKIEKIKELKERLSYIRQNREDYLNSDEKIDDLENLIGIYESEQLDE